MPCRTSPISGVSSIVTAPATPALRAQAQGGDGAVPCGTVSRILRAVGSRLSAGSLPHRHSLERLHKLLTRQIEAGLLFLADDDSLAGLPISRTDAATVSQLFIKRLPTVRKLLASDVEAAYLGDPAAQTYSEVISCYPAIRALTNYRLAHELHRLNVPLIPRILTEMAHSETGIDIHPAAQIGPSFTIDHGTGVVIGATCIIGSHVKLYQGVTLGARSFPLDADGNPIKNIPRHPILEDRVVVYSNATVLGRIRIGHDAVIGGNLWVTSDVPPEARLVQSNRASQ